MGSQRVPIRVAEGRDQVTATAANSVSPVLIELLLAMLEGSMYANAVMPWRAPAPIRLPDDRADRAKIVEAHLLGTAFEVLYSPKDAASRLIRIDTLVLAAFCPAADGRCRWLMIDLDGLDHGEKGLRDPHHAVRCIAERAANAGLLAGLVTARSRRGIGLHVFLFPPAPCDLVDGVIVIGALIADAYRAATAAMTECGIPHAFRCGDGTIAKPGQAGAVELIPRSTTRPELGWPITLPGAGAYSPSGGGLIIDPFSGEPISLRVAPRADSENWLRYLEEAKLRYRRNAPTHLPPPRSRSLSVNSRSRIDPRTRAFLAGRVQEGQRADSAYASACNLIGIGIDACEVRQLILDGAAACGLPAVEATNAVASAIATLRRRNRP